MRVARRVCIWPARMPEGSDATERLRQRRVLPGIRKTAPFAGRPSRRAGMAGDAGAAARAEGQARARSRLWLWLVQPMGEGEWRRRSDGRRRLRKNARQGAHDDCRSGDRLRAERHRDVRAADRLVRPRLQLAHAPLSRGFCAARRGGASLARRGREVCLLDGASGLHRAGGCEMVDERGGRKGLAGRPLFR